MHEIYSRDQAIHLKGLLVELEIELRCLDMMPKLLPKDFGIDLHPQQVPRRFSD